MKEYIFICIAVILMSFQLVFSKLYQSKANCKNAALVFPLITGVVAFILFFIISGFKIYYSSFSILMAFCGALITTVFSLIGLKAVKEISVSIYSAFTMLGALIIPFIYGVLILREPLSPLMIVGVVVLVVALVINAIEKGEQSKGYVKGIIYCLIVFTLNGVFGVLSKIHQINENAVDTSVFLQWITLFQALFSLIILIIKIVIDNKNNKEIDADSPKFNVKSLVKPVLIGAGYSAFWGIGFYFQLIALKKLAVSIANPIVTGAVIVLSSVISSIIFKNKIKLKQICAYAIMVIGIVLFIL